MRIVFAVGLMVALGACVTVPPAEMDAPPKPSDDEIAAVLDAPPPPPDARRVDEFDTTTEAQRVAALETDETGDFLGNEVVTLGDPSRAGFWIETALVSVPSTGRVELVDGGASVELALLPSAGSGRISLAALRLLEVPLTELVEVEVYDNQ